MRVVVLCEYPVSAAGEQARLIQRIGVLAASGKARLRFMGTVCADPGESTSGQGIAAIDAESMGRALAIRADLLREGGMAERLRIRLVEVDPSDFSFAFLP